MARRVTAGVLCGVMLLLCLFCAGADGRYKDTQSHWAQDYIDEAAERGLFSGTSEDTFSPDAEMTRAMFFTVLGKAAGADTEKYPVALLSSLYDDADPFAWYAPSLAWAVCTGIIDGMNEPEQTLFRPDEPIEREQAAVCISNCLCVCGCDLFTEMTATCNSPLPEEFGPSATDVYETSEEPEFTAEPEYEPETGAEPEYSEETELSSAAAQNTRPGRDLEDYFDDTPVRNTDSEPAQEDEPETEPSSRREDRTHAKSVRELSAGKDGSEDIPSETEPPACTEPAETEAPAFASIPETHAFTPSGRETVRPGDGEENFASGEPEYNPDSELLAAQYSDAESISAFAVTPVCRLKEIGVFSGLAPQQPGVLPAFAPHGTLTRAECAVLFCKLQDYLQAAPATAPVPVSNLLLNVDEWTLEEGTSITLDAMIFPANASMSRVLWYCEDSTVASVTDGTVTGLSAGETAVFAVCADGSAVSCALTVTAPPEAPAAQTFDGIPSTYEEKCDYVYGHYVSDHRRVYSSEEEALSNMTSIIVKVWNFDENGEKYTVTRWLTVHKNVADLAAKIFDEIYNLPEQPVIHTLGGYRWDGVCEHSVGLAIDINYSENYYCDPSGRAIVGGYFKPGEDPYSIPVGGSVDQIFEKYGFIRGINWSSGYKDYMHYSFFGW